MNDVDDGGAQVRSVLTVAEASRPYRQFKREGASDPQEKRGRPRKGTSTRSKGPVRVNWQQPVLWNQILDACDHVDWPWEPTRIAKRLHDINARSFATFAPQRISDWRDPQYTDKLVWKKNVLSRPGVSDGNRVRGNVTCHGVLVSRSLVSLLIVYTVLTGAMCIG